MRIGEPGTTLSETVEAPIFMIESDRGSGIFRNALWTGDEFQVTARANEVPVAEFDISLADQATFYSESPAEDLSDWLIRGDGGSALRPEETLLGGRRIQICTQRAFNSDDWILFEGFVDKLRLGFSGSGQRGRRLRGIAVGTIVAADRERSQQLYGQWRRTCESEIARITGTGDARICIRTPVPLVLNPGGLPNCDPRQLLLDDGSVVYIPCDVKYCYAIPWTVAKALRYLQFCAVQAAPPLIETDHYDIPAVSSTQGVHNATWTSFGLLHANLNEIVETELGTGDLLSADPDAGLAFGMRALLRAIPDIALDGMSVLEAFTYLCDRAGISWHSYCASTAGGRVDTYMKLNVRGHVLPDDAVPAPLPNVAEEGIGLE